MKFPLNGGPFDIGLHANDTIRGGYEISFSNLIKPPPPNIACWQIINIYPYPCDPSAPRPRTSPSWFLSPGVFIDRFYPLRRMVYSFCCCVGFGTTCFVVASKFKLWNSRNKIFTTIYFNYFQTILCTCYIVFTCWSGDLNFDIVNPENFQNFFKVKCERTHVFLLFILHSCSFTFFFSSSFYICHSLTLHLNYAFLNLSLILRNYLLNISSSFSPQ